MKTTAADIVGPAFCISTVEVVQISIDLARLRNQGNMRFRQSQEDSSPQINIVLSLVFA